MFSNHHPCVCHMYSRQQAGSPAFASSRAPAGEPPFILSARIVHFRCMSLPWPSAYQRPRAHAARAKSRAGIKDRMCSRSRRRHSTRRGVRHRGGSARPRSRFPIRTLGLSSATDSMRQTSVDQLARKCRRTGVNELAHVFLSEHQRPKPSALCFEKSRRDPWAFERSASPAGSPRHCCRTSRACPTASWGQDDGLTLSMVSVRYGATPRLARSSPRSVTSGGSGFRIFCSRPSHSCSRCRFSARYLC